MRRKNVLFIIPVTVLLVIGLVILGLNFFKFESSDTGIDHTAKRQSAAPINPPGIIKKATPQSTQTPRVTPSTIPIFGTTTIDREKAAEIAEKEAEIALANWEAIIDRLYEQDEEVNIKRDAPLVKAAFAKLSKEVQEEEIHYALNLLSDEQFPVLYPILFDKTQSEDVLEAIFDDALNRPEEIKNPLMQTLRKDRKHPMYFESARILDAMGMDEDETAKVKTEADDN